MIEGIRNYLISGASFDQGKKRWLFAIESNKNYPHAIWWEKDGDGIDHMNPSVSLATFLVCFEKENELYRNILREAFVYLRESDIKSDELKCFFLSYRLLLNTKIYDVISLPDAKLLLTQKLLSTICSDVSKYGVEYAAAPSDFFAGQNRDFMNEELAELYEAERKHLPLIQKEDGGFDISWQWYTPYEEFEVARKQWRAKITLEKLLFLKIRG